jgi:hypothetical protein
MGIRFRFRFGSGTASNWKVGSGSASKRCRSTTLVNLSPAASILCWQRLRLRAAKQTTTKLFYERPKEEVVTHVKEVPRIQPRLEVGQNLGDFLDGVCEHKLALLQLKRKESITD